MDATTFEDRKEELLNECELAPQVFQRVMPRLERFMMPFVDCLVRLEQVEHAGTFVRGLLSDLEHKNAESIAYRFDQERMPLQWFLGVSPWDDEPLRDELARVDEGSKAMREGGHPEERSPSHATSVVPGHAGEAWRNVAPFVDHRR